MASEQHNTVIKVTGDVKSAVNGLNMVQAAAGRVRTAVMGIFSGFGMVSFAIAALGSLTAAYRKLDEFVNRAAIKAGEKMWADTLQSAADGIDALTRKQQTYNRVLKDELDTLAKAAELRSLKQSGDDYVATSLRDFDRAKELAGTTDEREKLAIKQRWKEEDARAALETRISGNADRIADEDEKNSIYASKASAASDTAAATQKQIDDLMFERDVRAQADAEKRKQLTAEIKKLQEIKRAAEQSAATYGKEANASKERVKLLEEEKRKLEELRSTVVEKVKTENAVEMSEFDKKRKEEAEEEFRQLQEAARERSDQAAAFVEGEAERQDADHKAAADRYGGYADSLIGTAGSRGNRLTAMGLGDGASGNTLGTISSDIRTIVGLFRQNIEATRNLRFGAGGAVYGE